VSKTSKDDLPELEAMIDRHGLYCVLSMLSDIASEKAEHLRSNWGDKGAAHAWEKACSYIDTAGAKVDALSLP
jgi:hypothetical protein